MMVGTKFVIMKITEVYPEVIIIFLLNGEYNAILLISL